MLSMEINVTHVNRCLILLKCFILTIVHADFLFKTEGQQCRFIFIYYIFTCKIYSKNVPPYKMTPISSISDLKEIIKIKIM